MNQNIVTLRPRGNDFHVLKDTETDFFETLGKLAEDVEQEHCEQATRFSFQTLLLSSFGKEPMGMRLVKKFPAGLEYEFWRRVLNLMYPQNDGFIAAANEGLLLREAQDLCKRLFECSSSPAPWNTYPYRCLAAAVVNTAAEFIHRK